MYDGYDNMVDFIEDPSEVFECEQKLEQGFFDLCFLLMIILFCLLLVELLLLKLMYHDRVPDDMKELLGLPADFKRLFIILCSLCFIILVCFICSGIVTFLRLDMLQHKLYLQARVLHLPPEMWDNIAKYRLLFE